MKALRRILAETAPVLFVDSSSARIQVAVLRTESFRWAPPQEDAENGIFRAMAALAVRLEEVRAFVYADSPGSILGIRIAAMAIRTWCGLEPRPVHAYNGLALLASAIGRPELTLIADARRGQWHCCRLGQEPWRQSPEGLAGPLATAAEFRHWSALPPGVESLSYDLAQWLPRAIEAEIFRPTDAPDALAAPPDYLTWSRAVHQRP